jgi:hypothetical protein
MYRIWFLSTSLAIVAALGLVATRAADTVDPRLAGFPELTFRLTEERIEAPAEVEAGRILLIEENDGPHNGHAFILRVPDEVADEELAAVLSDDAAAAEETPTWFFQAWFVGNGDRAAPNRPAIALVDLRPGRYVIGDPFRPASEYAVFNAVAPASAAAAPVAPEADVAIDLFEMDFTIPDDLSAGRQVWAVTNTGAMLHEIALFPVPAGATKEQAVEAVIAAGDVTFFGAERTPEVEAALAAIGPDWAGWQLDLAGGVGVISPQATSYAQLDLPAGTYAAVCFFPGPDGTPHFITGMTKVFEVAPSAS